MPQRLAYVLEGTLYTKTKLWEPGALWSWQHGAPVVKQMRPPSLHFSLSRNSILTPVPTDLPLAQRKAVTHTWRWQVQALAVGLWLSLHLLPFSFEALL